LGLEQLEVRTTPTAGLLQQQIVAEVLEQAPVYAPGASYYLALMRPDGSFPDFNYSGSSDASAADLYGHGQRLEILSLAYRWNDPSNAWFHSPQLRSQILAGWDYLATRAGSVNAPNWWWKAIGVPQGMAEGLLLMRDEISANLRNQVLQKYFGSVWNPSKYDGANVTYQAPMAIIDGLLRGNTGRIREVVNRVSGELSAYSGEGIQRDLSFHQHKQNNRPNYYSGHYGLVLAQDTAKIMRWAAGTDFAFGTAAVDQELRFLLDHLQWLTRGDTFDVASMGRMVTFPNQLSNAPVMLQDALADMLPLGRRTGELLSAIDRYQQGVSDANALWGNKSLWRSDALGHQRPEMATTLRMLSSRTLRPETAAGNNTRGFFEGDGFTLFLQDGDELGARGEQSIIPVWDWQRVPGTTVQHNGYIPYYDMFKTGTNSTGSSGLVGSASDGNYGVAMMDYRRGGVSLTARKSWFFFDDEVVALGAGINDAKASAPVFTSLNQVLLDGSVTVQDAAGRRTLELGGWDSLAGVSWIHHDDLGYVVLDGASRTTVQAQTQSGGGVSLPVFSAWVDHGPRPRNQTYAYAVVPGVTPDELDQYAGNSPLAIMANTSTVQAVRHQELAQTQVAFYAAGTTWINDTTCIYVNQPVLLIVREVEGDLVITAADPQQRSTSLTINVNRRLIGAGARWVASGGYTSITLPLPSSPYLGASVTRTYAGIQGEPVLIAAQADASVRGGSYAGSNFGGATTLPVQNYNSSYAREALVRFETSAIQGEVVFAEVRLMAVSGNRPATIAAAPALNNTWHESFVTWNSKPASGPELGRVTVKRGQLAAFDVTNLVRAAAASGEPISLRLYGPTKSRYLVELASAEHHSTAYRPVLEVYVRETVVDPPAEGESLAERLSRAALAPYEVTGPLRLSDYLTTSRLPAFGVGSYGPQLPAPPLVTPAETPAATLARSSKPNSTSGDLWDPAAVDLALGVIEEPDDSIL
jgi:chondroitin AC lyase